ncbi:MAG TPA: SPW repeat protein [Candidatus Eisenbacteria bacterium]|nr:SPW repeat protein [Candidatus Eisenbacteria bacterium]
MSEQTLRQRKVSTDVLLLDSVREPGLRAPGGRAHRIPKIRGRAQEVAAMTTWRRWQDWVVVGLGVVLFVTPFIFGETANSVAASTAYVLGALIALAGVLNAATKDAGGLELIPAVLAVILFVSPWAFGFSAVTGLAWAAWIIAILIVLTVGSLFAMQNRRAIA